MANSSENSPPQINFQHTPPKTLWAGQRTPLLALISSPIEIDEVRCYFRADQDRQWLFVRAQFAGINHYACDLPRFDEHVESVDYRWLLVNSIGQVILTPIIELLRGERPLFSAIGNHDDLNVFDELWGNYQAKFEDIGVITNSVSDDSHRYGLLAGLYQAEEIPHWFDAKSGYFGGFEVDINGGNPFPVEGFAPGLTPNQLESHLLSAFSADLVVSSPIIQIAGNDWSGYFETTGFNNQQNLNASIGQSGSNVNITTTKSGLAHRFIGSINSSGHILVYDQYDGEDWTTHFGPASSSSVNLYDYIRPPTASDPTPPLNKVILSRVVIVPPPVPASVSASDSSNTQIDISWAAVSGAPYYLVYRCETSTTSSCAQIASTSSYSITDTPSNKQVWYYRVKACNSAGCSTYSSAAQAKLVTVNMVGPLVPLLFD